MFQAFNDQKGPFIRELEAGQRIIGFYLVRGKQLEAFRDPTRGMYLSLLLADRSGQIPGRVWEDAEKAAEGFERGDVVKIDGEVETYMERNQVRVLRLRKAQPDEFDWRDFLRSSKRDLDEMLKQVNEFSDRIGDPHLRALVDAFYRDPQFMAQFRQAPAARRVHHAYLGGLLEHTVDTLILADAVLKVYPQLDPDLLIAGVLLHHVGKVREYSWDRDIEYTEAGALVGHIVLTMEMVSQAIATIPDFPEELALRVRHLLVSQRGRYEWGSPRLPQTLEAIALHHLENLNAQVNRFQQLLENRPEGEAWTGYDRLLGRQLYAGPSDDLETERTGEEDWAPF